MTFVDLQPAAVRMADLITRVPDGLLRAATPCTNYSVGDLLDHIDRLALAFTAAATKAAGDAASDSPSGDVARLGDDWRTRIPGHLTALTEAWRVPAARIGLTRAGGVEMPGEVAAVVALEELVIHGWDVATASRQSYYCDQPTLGVVRDFVAQFAGADQAELRGEAYASPVAVPETAPFLDRVIGLSGRDPAWSSP